MTGRVFLSWGVSTPKPADMLLEGAGRLGTVHLAVPGRFEPDDVAIVWAPFIGTPRHGLARDVRAAGGRVIVVENGWLSPIGTERYWQVALDGWNGAGRFVAGDASRWRSWGVPLAPWRNDGDFVLVVEQRAHGINGDPRAMPPGWAQSVRPRTARRVVRRTRATRAPLDAQLDRAFATLTWTSTVAIKGLVRGVPAFYCGPGLNCSELMTRGLELDVPARPDREPVFERDAWQQWNEREIRSGEPFARLLELPHDGLPGVFASPEPVTPAWTLAGRLRAWVGTRLVERRDRRLVAGGGRPGARSPGR